MQDIIVGIGLIALFVLAMWKATRSASYVPSAITLPNPAYTPIRTPDPVEEHIKAQTKLLKAQLEADPWSYGGLTTVRDDEVVIPLPQKEEKSVSSCSAKERITEMRLRALETGQPIDTMELVREALTVLQSPITGYSSDGYGYAREFAQKQAEATALLQFALDRAGNPQPATEQAEAV